MMGIANPVPITMFVKRVKVRNAKVITTTNATTPTQAGTAVRRP
jgi:hypothetical protein